MHRHNSVSHISVCGLFEPHFFHHLSQLLLAQEPLDTLYEVLVRVLVSSDCISHLRNHME